MTSQTINRVIVRSNNKQLAVYTLNQGLETLVYNLTLSLLGKNC